MGKLKKSELKSEAIKVMEKRTRAKNLVLGLRVGAVLSIIIGVITLDRGEIIIGVILFLSLFLGPFLFYYIRQRKYIKDDSVYIGYKVISKIRRVLGGYTVADDNNLSIMVLFYVGLIRGAKSFLHLNNEQKSNLTEAIFRDLGVIIQEDSAQLFSKIELALNNDEDAKVFSFGVETFTLFVRGGEAVLTDINKHLSNDFGKVTLKLN